jgi:hypothetical protein
MMQTVVVDSLKPCILWAMTYGPLDDQQQQQQTEITATVAPDHESGESPGVQLVRFCQWDHANGISHLFYSVLILFLYFIPSTFVTSMHHSLRLTFLTGPGQNTLLAIDFDPFRLN